MAGFEDGKIDCNYTAYGTICGPTSDPGQLQVVAPGTSTHVLTSNGAAALPSYQASGGGGAGTWTAITDGSLSGSAVSITSGLGTAYEDYMVIIKDMSSDTGSETYTVLWSIDAGSSYTVTNEVSGIYNNITVKREQGAGIPFGDENIDSGDVQGLMVYFTGNKTNNYKYVWTASTGSVSDNEQGLWMGLIETTSDIDALRFTTTAGDFDAGTYEIFGK